MRNHQDVPPFTLQPYRDTCVLMAAESFVRPLETTLACGNQATGIRTLVNTVKFPVVISKQGTAMLASCCHGGWIKKEDFGVVRGGYLCRWSAGAVQLDTKRPRRMSRCGGC